MSDRLLATVFVWVLAFSVTPSKADLVNADFIVLPDAWVQAGLVPPFSLQDQPTITGQVIFTTDGELRSFNYVRVHKGGHFPMLPVSKSLLRLLPTAMLPVTVFPGDFLLVPMVSFLLTHMTLELPLIPLSIIYSQTPLPRYLMALTD